MKTIAIDVDEVLARHNYALAQFYNQRYGTQHTEADYFTEQWSKIWRVSEEEAERRALEFHLTGLHASFEVVSGAREALDKLKEEYKLVVVTIRRPQVIVATRRWLEQNFPGVFSDVRFAPNRWIDKNPQTKADICRELDAQWLIDDSVRHVSTMAESGGKGLLFGNYTWNQTDLLPTGVKRVKDWSAVMEYFSNARG